MFEGITYDVDILDGTVYYTNDDGEAEEVYELTVQNGEICRV